MSEKWLIAVTAGRWQANSIKVAQSMGIKVIAIDSNPKAEGLTIADYSIVAPLNNFKEIVDLTEAALQGNCISGVLSICSDAGMLLAGHLREYFGVSTGPDIETSEALINKKLQRQAWTNDHINKLNWYTVKNVESAHKAESKLTLPYIIKPVDSAGSRGVFKVEEAEPIDSYIEEALSFSPTNEAILESFMEGKEYTVEGFVHRGNCDVLAITEKDKIPSANNLVAYKLQTAQLPSALEDKISRLVINSVASLNYQNGPVHAEVIVMEDGEVGMVELAGRGGGFMVYEAFVKAQSGFDIVKNTILQAVGLPIDEMVKRKEHTILRFYPNTPGRVTSISGFDEANALSGVAAGAFVEPGVILDMPKSDGDRMGYYLCHGPTVEAAEKLAQKAEVFIHIEVNDSE